MLLFAFKYHEKLPVNFQPKPFLARGKAKKLKIVFFSIFLIKRIAK